MAELGPETGELAELRRLLGIVDAEGVRRAEAHAASHVATLSRELPDAVRTRMAEDDELSDALATPVERALKLSIVRDPSPVVNALAPMIGQTIRKSVALALDGLIQAFNNALDVSLSPASIGWRIEAWRTGQSFAEVALVKSLVYRVEQVFVIHRETGLMLQHAVLPAVQAQDADMVSGMLTAIQDFVRDSFRTDEGSALDLMKVGDLEVWVERSLHMAFAAVVRGRAPAALRVRQQEVLAELERLYGARLTAFDGDARPFEKSLPLIETCLAVEQRPKAPSSPWPRRLVLVVAAVAAAGLVVRRCAHEEPVVTVEESPADPWAKYVAALAAMPGVVILEAKREGERLVISGLRDPLAEDPMALVGAMGLEVADVRATWLAFVSLEPAFVRARALQVLRPPEGVTIAVEEGSLKISGAAPHGWIAATRTLAPVIAGVTAVEIEVVDTTELQWSAAVSAVDAARVQFSVNVAEVMDDAAARAALMTLDALAVELERDVTVSLVAHRDEPATARNRMLQRARLRAVDAALRGGWRRVRVVPVTAALDDEEVSPGRTVNLRVEA